LVDFRTSSHRSHRSSKAKAAETAEIHIVDIRVHDMKSYGSSATFLVYHSCAPASR